MAGDHVTQHLAGYAERMEQLQRRAQGTAPAGPRAQIEGASMSRRTAGWPAPRTSINAQLARQGGTLLARVRDAGINAPYIVNARDGFGADIVGTGIVPSPRTDDQALNERAEKEFLRWTNYAAADGVLDYYGQMALGAYELFEAGEYFIRLRRRRPEDGLRVPLQIQLLAAEMLPVNKSERLASGNVIRMGIEFDPIGRRVAYHFYRVHPHDLTDMQPGWGLTVRVPASEVRHVYDPRRIGQLRGLPRPTAALTRNRMRDDYEDAELDRKRSAASFVTVVSDDTGGGAGGDPYDGHDGGGGDDEKAAATADPFVDLAPGTSAYIGRRKVTFNSPPDSGPNYEQFDYRALLTVAAGTGMPYQKVTGDILKANYANQRAGLVEWRRRGEMLQHHVIAHQHCRPVWECWVQTAALAGVLGPVTPEQVEALQLDVDFRPPRWEWVDPLKDVTAELKAIDGGLDSRDAGIERRGESPADVDRRRAAGRDRERKHGLEKAPTRQPQRPQQPPGPGWR